MYSFLDTDSTTSGQVSKLYTPDSGKGGKTAGAVASESGELYYSTSSGTVIALEKKDNDTPDPTPGTPMLSKVSADRRVKDTTVADLTVKSSVSGTLYYTVTGRNASQPDVFASGKTKSVKAGTNEIKLTDLSDHESTVWVGLKTSDGETTEIKSADIAAVVKAEITVNPSDAKLTVKRGKTSVEKQSGKDGKYTYRLVAGEKYTMTARRDGYVTYAKVVTAKSSKTSYAITLLSKDCKLEQLSLSSSSTNVKADFTMEPTFDPSKTSYTAKTTRDIDAVYLWLRKSDSSASCHVYGKKGVSKKSMRKNQSLYAESTNGYQRYAFRFAGGRSTATLSIKVKAADKTERTYEVKVKRADKTPPKLKTITKGTGRTGADSATVIVHSTEAATGHLKVANPGVVPTEIVKTGASFSLKKGDTTLRISKLASTERHLYIVAVDKNGNKSAKLKVVIPAYKSITPSSANTNKRTTGTQGNTNRNTSWLNRIANSGNKATPSTGNGNKTTSVTGGKTTSGTTGTTGTTTNPSTTTGTTGGVTGGTTTGSSDDNVRIWNSADDTTIDTGVTDSTMENDANGADSVDNGGSGNVPDNSVISDGTPAWQILVILIVVCGVGFGVYWFIIRRKHPDA